MIKYATKSIIMIAFFTGVAHADGEAIYNQGCVACHASGVAGAPKVGDADAWKDRIAKGIEVLYTNSIEGFTGETGVMLPKGGFAHLSDDDVKSAVDYMVEQSTGN